MKRNWLINIRKSKQLTQQYVASNSYIDRSFYSHIENGKRNPSLTVAQNIAAVLEFDHLNFFMDDQDSKIAEKTNLILDTDEFLRKMESGHILYLYNNFNCYINYAVTFSLLGVEKESFCFIMDTPTNFSEIENNLKRNLDKNEMEYIHHINKEELMNQSLENLNIILLKMLLTKLEGKNSIFLWCHIRRYHPNDWIFKLHSQLNYEESRINKKGIITLHSYDASLVSAQAYIELMRKVPYLMTDSEIVESPLYHSSTKEEIYPSLYMQEDT